MKLDDDTVRTDAQAQEDATVALLKANGVPGLPVQSFELTDDASLDHAIEQTSTLTDALCFYEIERAAVRRGESAGRGAALTLAQLPENLHGSVVLSFSGYAGDSRPLWHIPEVVRFARGMVLGSARRPDLDHAKTLLRVLMDERPYVDLETLEADPMFEQAAGGLFLVRLAFPDECWMAPNVLDVELNVAIYNWLIGEGEAPG